MGEGRRGLRPAAPEAEADLQGRAQACRGERVEVASGLWRLSDGQQQSFELRPVARVVALQAAAVEAVRAEGAFGREEDRCATDRCVCVCVVRSG